MHTHTQILLLWHVLQVYKRWFTIPSFQWTPGECNALFGCTSVINNCCSGPALGQTDLAAFSCTAGCFVWEITSNSLLCNKDWKCCTETQQTHKNTPIFLWWRIHETVSFSGSWSINICLGFAFEKWVCTKRKIVCSRLLFFSPSIPNSPGNL